MKLQEGDVIRLEPGMTVYTDVPASEVFDNCAGEIHLAHFAVAIEGDRLWLAGDYVVLRRDEGLGTSRAGYTNGVSILCQSLRDPSRRCDFFVGGDSRIRMEREPVAIGRATQTWTRI